MKTAVEPLFREFDFGVVLALVCLGLALWLFNMAGSPADDSHPVEHNVDPPAAPPSPPETPEETARKNQI